MSWSTVVGLDSAEVSGSAIHLEFGGGTWQLTVGSSGLSGVPQDANGNYLVDPPSDVSWNMIARQQVNVVVSSEAFAAAETVAMFSASTTKSMRFTLDVDSPPDPVRA